MRLIVVIISTLPLLNSKMAVLDSGKLELTLLFLDELVVTTYNGCVFDWMLKCLETVRHYICNLIILLNFIIINLQSLLLCSC